MNLTTQTFLYCTLVATYTALYFIVRNKIKTYPEEKQDLLTDCLLTLPFFILGLLPLSIGLILNHPPIVKLGILNSFATPSVNVLYKIKEIYYSSPK